ncbi:MAG: hypothetical protein CR982_07560 [Candidatus Cloacimonadota bacterium]|nr:MAG: hypothetical protein CR982_07560 [Candidatus Cloacimonadota bacterium]PIE80187.1 MAG: hypothetical protein CSA15_02205 [Candidatus Delongbacteria bacterium]
MKKFSLLIFLLSVSFVAFANEGKVAKFEKVENQETRQYDVGDVCSNITFTTTDGVTTSIYEQVDAGKPVMIFWGSAG